MRIITDSAADFTREELAAYNIHCVHTQIIFGEETFQAGVNMEDDEFWARMMAGETPHTSQPSPAAFLAEFEAAKAAGEEAVCVCISSSLSGTYQSANLAASMAEYGGVHIVDALTGAAAQKLLVLHACRLRDEGRMLAREVAQKLEVLRSRVHLFAGLDTLDNLARSGRIPQIVASIGSLARLKPMVQVDRQGYIVLGGKAFGRHRAIDALAQKIAAVKIDRNHPIIPIYSYSKENMQALIGKLRTLGVAVDEKLVSALGPSIAGHIGPNAYGVALVEAE